MTAFCRVASVRWHHAEKPQNTASGTFFVCVRLNACSSRETPSGGAILERFTPILEILSAVSGFSQAFSSTACDLCVQVGMRLRPPDHSFRFTPPFSGNILWFSLHCAGCILYQKDTDECMRRRVFGYEVNSDTILQRQKWHTFSSPGRRVPCAEDA